MGTPPFAARCLERVLETRHELVAVVTRPDKAQGRGLELRPSAVKTLATAHDIEILAPASAKDPAFAERLRAIAPDLAVVVAYGRILPAAVLRVPRLGCINAHASLLPKLRGAAPIERAILEGFTQTGVTIMRINERLDAGDMLMSQTVAIPEEMDAGALRESLAGVAGDLLCRAIEMLARGAARFVAQEEGEATYAPPLQREEGRLDWRDTAARIGRRVRAFAPQPGAFTTALGRRLKVLRGRPLLEQPERPAGTILTVRGDGLAVACGNGVYVAEIVQPEGKREMSAAAWRRGNAGVDVLGDHA
jgi:methionyl-tRNA formyltransferase